MVSRAEQVLSGLISVLFLTLYQYGVEPHIVKDSTFEMRLFGNVMVWVFSFVFVLILLMLIKRKMMRRRMEAAY